MTTDHCMLRAIDMGWFILDEYYTMTDSVPAYAVATLLNPSKRYAWIQKNWPESWWNNAVAGARHIWLTEYQDVQSGSDTRDNCYNC